MTAPERLDRAGFDALIQRHVLALIAAARRPRRTDPSAPARQVVEGDAALVEAQAREFAETVDRDGSGIPYEEAVVITGSAGPVVVTADDYKRTPIYWQAKAGEVDGVTFGAELIGQLRAT